MWKDCKKAPLMEFSTHPPQSLRRKRWQSAPSTPFDKKKSTPARPAADSFHVLHKVPTGDSPYVKAKHVQLIDKDPNKAISLFWSAINAGDRVDSALKDMAIVMKQLNRADEAIEAIKSFRHLCAPQSQESLDNVLIDLYKISGRIEEHIELLQYKLRLIDEGVAFNGMRTKIARSQGKKFIVSVEQERARLLGNLAWAHMQQQSNYRIAEELYREALSIESDKNMQCNLAICLMNRGLIKEAKSILEDAQTSSTDRETEDCSYIKSFDRALETLSELEGQSVQNLKDEVSSADDRDEIQGFGLSKWKEGKEKVFNDSFNITVLKQERGPYFRNQSGYSVDSSGCETKGRCGIEQTSNAQISCSPLTGKKAVPSTQNVFREASHFPCLRNEEMTIQSRTEGSGPSSKNMSTDINKFESPVLIRRNTKLKSTEQSCYSQSSAKDWRSGISQGGKKEADKHGCIPSHLQMDSPVTVGISRPIDEGSSCYKSGNSWVNMVEEEEEEEEEELLRECTEISINRRDYLSQESFHTPRKWVRSWYEEDTFHNENTSSNIMDSTPLPPSSLSKLTPQMHQSPQEYHTQRLQKFKLVDLEGERYKRSADKCSTTRRVLSFDQKEYLTQKLQKFKLIDLEEGERYKTSARKCSTTRRVLSFDQKEHNGTFPADKFCPLPLQKKAFDLENHNCTPFMGSKLKDMDPVRRGNRRLQVFQDIRLQDRQRHYS